MNKPEEFFNLFSKDSDGKGGAGVMPVYVGQ